MFSLSDLSNEAERPIAINSISDDEIQPKIDFEYYSPPAHS